MMNTKIKLPNFANYYYKKTGHRVTALVELNITSNELAYTQTIKVQVYNFDTNSIKLFEVDNAKYGNFYSDVMSIITNRFDTKKFTLTSKTYHCMTRCTDIEQLSISRGLFPYDNTTLYYNWASQSFIVVGHNESIPGKIKTYSAKEIFGKLTPENLSCNALTNDELCEYARLLLTHSAEISNIPYLVYEATEDFEKFEYPIAVSKYLESTLTEVKKRLDNSSFKFKGKVFTLVNYPFKGKSQIG